MNRSRNFSLHDLALAGVITLGTTLRFWHLDLKPLWLDEVLTALFSLGRSYQNVPLEAVFSLSTLQHLFELQPDISCSEIAQAVATQSTHPPVFFCLMHQWLSWLEPVTQSLSWKLRSLPALFGVSAIATLYCLNRLAFSRKAGLMGAALMAVSPFGVYLSQEARHYTLPMLLISLALLGLIQIQQDLFHRQQLPGLAVLLGWVFVNSIGLYVHYFFILAFIAQLITLTVLLCRGYRLLPHGSIIAIGLAILSVALSYLPWLPVLLGHMGRSETDWVPPPQNVAPVFQTLSSWLTMVIILPIEALLPA
ncbi:MAG: glycosyltransferase family 39 protein, partial [Coleofasciculus sp. S288]|nr:glycosyltransferase family 39 protein [Coleofasciculus sp. S288]